MPDTPAIFFANFQRLFEEGNMSQQEFADRAGLSQSLVSKYLKGETTPSLENIDKIAAMFGLTAIDLLRSDPPPKMEAKSMIVQQMINKVSEVDEIKEEALKANLLQHISAYIDLAKNRSQSKKGK